MHDGRYPPIQRFDAPREVCKGDEKLRCGGRQLHDVLHLVGDSRPDKRPETLEECLFQGRNGE
jgi:hypothetical protein